MHSRGEEEDLPGGVAAGTRGEWDCGVPVDHLAQRAVGSFRRYVDMHNRRIRVGEKRRTTVIGTIPEPLEVLDGRYVKAALMTSTMSWYLRALESSDLNMKVRGIASRGTSGSEEYIRAREAGTASLEQLGASRVAALRAGAVQAQESIRRAIEIGTGPAEMQALLQYPVWPWRVAISTNASEGGMAHTLHDVIVLPIECFSWSKPRLAQVMVHEATHVYQRMDRAGALAVLERDHRLIPASAMAARLDRLAEIYPFHRTYKMNGKDSSQAFSPKSGLLDVPDTWRQVSVAYADGDLDSGEARAFIVENLEQDPPPEPEGEARLNPDTDLEHWVQLPEKDSWSSWPGGGAAGWPGGYLWVGREFLKGSVLKDVELRDGDEWGPSMHPLELMAYAWQELAMP
jgi:hypothetical protein